MIDRKTVIETAALAKLALSDAEVDKLAKELGAITGYVARLSEVETSATPPAMQGLNQWREDETRKSVAPEKALMNAPSAEAGFFRVPQIVE